jgi:carotenoid 1,2-hydratase
VGIADGCELRVGPGFDVEVRPGGYAWWYLDALSDDKQQGLTIIAFVGSVFSPYYAWSRWRHPEDHCAMNAALYSVKGDRWAMTERGHLSLNRDANTIAIDRSSMRWDNEALLISIDEWTAPLPSRLRGTVTFRPGSLASQQYPLDDEARHIWRPIAPRGRVDVDFNGARWSGDAYFDSNWGSEPLESRFRAWDWSRAHGPDDATVVYYDVALRDGQKRSLALKFDATGAATQISPPPLSELPKTFWRVRPTTRGDHGKAPKLVRVLEDAPFYARSHLAGEIAGAPADIMHETLSLDRLRNPIVRAMLPFRMPRFVRRR